MGEVFRDYSCVVSVTPVIVRGIQTTDGLPVGDVGGLRLSHEQVDIDWLPPAHWFMPQAAVCVQTTARAPHPLVLLEALLSSASPLQALVGGRRLMTAVSNAALREGRSEEEVIDILDTVSRRLHAVAESAIEGIMAGDRVDRTTAIFMLYRDGIFDERHVCDYADMTHWQVEQYLDAHPELERPV